MTIFDDFFMRALIGGLGIAIAAAPLGCFIVWRRMAYFSDATAHSSILGVALALAFSVSIFFGTLFAALIMGLCKRHDFGRTRPLCPSNWLSRDVPYS